MFNRTSYDVRIATRLPKDMPKLISAAASSAFISPSAYVRQALAEKLKRDGFGLPSPDAGSAQQAA
jgi:predicted HicB family RNase H-like nuclease